MGSEDQGEEIGALVVRAALDEAGIPASPDEVAMLVGVQELVRSRADLLFAAEVDRWEPADVFSAGIPRVGGGREDG